jgi:hypothetical protein
MFALELKRSKSKVGVSALIPGVVNTNITTGTRNRPEVMKNPEMPMDPAVRQALMERYERVKQAYAGPEAMLPEVVADIVFHGIENDAMYIFTDLADEVGIKARTEQLLSDMDLLRRFIKTSGRPEEEFYHKGMGEGLARKYR